MRMAAMLDGWRGAALCALGGLVVGGGAIALAADDVAPQDRGAIEGVVRDYILAHPEIIPEAMKRLQAKETAKLIADNRKAIETPFAAAFAGAKDGDVTVVEFTDYACGYCRASLPDVERLVAEDARVRVIYREMPILSDDSTAAARVALGAARQGRYGAFRHALYAAGAPSAAHLAAVAASVGLDRGALTAVPGAEDEIANNIALGRTLGLSGTPSFIVGDQMLSGAVGYDALKTAVAEARKRG